jgi:hypothetical protein
VPCLTYRFDDLPLLGHGDLFAAHVSGEALIDYEPDSLEWTVERITVTGDNGRTGPHAETGDIDLPRSGVWFHVACAAINRFEHEAIDEEIARLERAESTLHARPRSTERRIIAGGA